MIELLEPLGHPPDAAGRILASKETRTAVLASLNRVIKFFIDNEMNNGEGEYLTMEIEKYIDANLEVRLSQIPPAPELISKLKQEPSSVILKMSFYLGFGLNQSVDELVKHLNEPESLLRTALKYRNYSLFERAIEGGAKDFGHAIMSTELIIHYRQSPLQLFNSDVRDRMIDELMEKMSIMPNYRLDIDHDKGKVAIHVLEASGEWYPIGWFKK